MKIIDMKDLYIAIIGNSRFFWKFLIFYLLLLVILFSFSDSYLKFSTTEIIFIVVYVLSLWMVTICLTVYYIKKLWGYNFLSRKIIYDNDKKILDSVMVLNKNDEKKLLKYVKIQLINSWYLVISKNEAFSKESELLVENTLKVMNEIFSSVNQVHFAYALGNIVLKHLKKFRKYSKFKEKNGVKVSQIFRVIYSSLSDEKEKEFYIHQMTKNLLSNLVHCELWNSISCQLVIAMISSKLSYLIDVCANPEFLNYHLLRCLTSVCIRNKLNMDQYGLVKLDVTENKTEYPTKKILICAVQEERNLLENIPSKETESNIVCTLKTSVDFKDQLTPVITSKPIESLDLNIEKNDHPSLGCEGFVKVYEPKGTFETWCEEFDLESAILGEDSLEFPNISPESKETKNFSHIEEITRQIIRNPYDITTNTLRDIRDFQENTVNTVVKPMSHATSQALNKIGDLQDEAAGVVEGLFDFGMAGIRKGLKLTGLQEHSLQDTTIFDVKLKHANNYNNIASQKKLEASLKNEYSLGSIDINQLQTCGIFNDEEYMIDNMGQVPSITMESSEFESPDLEYEETADLASTIAKLRTLLQRKSSDSSLASPAASPIIPGENKLMMDLEDANSFVPSFYKLCAKTASGVFNNTLNTLKTALPNGNDTIYYGIEKWNYEISGEKGVTLLIKMNKLIQKTQDFHTVEPAYDPLESFQTAYERKTNFDIKILDELDEFDSNISLAKTLFDIICELISDSETVLSKEPLVKFILSVFGMSTNEAISNEINFFLQNPRITKIPIKSNAETLTLDIDVFIDYLISGLPDYVIAPVGYTAIRDALTILVSFIQVRMCNQDLIFQIFEFISLMLMEKCRKK